MYSIFLIIFVIVFVYLIWRTQAKRNNVLNETFAPRVRNILDKFNDDPIKSVLQADSLLHEMLKYMGYKGTMGEVLKSSSKLFSKEMYNTVWKVHKLRNKIANESHTKELTLLAGSSRKDLQKIFTSLGLKL